MKKFVGILVLLFACYTQLLAQANTLATITGRVIDENKEAIPGAAVFVKNESTGFSTGTVTNVNGEYTVRQIPLGSPYTIRVTYVGYGDQTRSNYTLNQGDVLRLDFQMSESTVEVAEVQVVANSMKKKGQHRIDHINFLTRYRYDACQRTQLHIVDRPLSIEQRQQSGWTNSEFDQLHH